MPYTKLVDLVNLELKVDETNLTLDAILAQLDDATTDTVLSVLQAVLIKLDTIGIAGTISLSPTTLTALENISIDNFPATQTVSGIVALDAPTLAALESITVTVANQITGYATETTLASILSAVDGVESALSTLNSKDFATQTTLAALLTEVGQKTLIKKTTTATASGNNTIHTPASGKRIRLYFFGYSAGSNVNGVLVGMKFGSSGTIFDNQYLTAAGQPYARNIQAGKRFIDGNIDEPLIVELNANQTIYVNVELSEES